MIAKPKLSDDGRTVTMRVPIAIKKRGGRKLVLAPGGAQIRAPITRHVDNATVKAIARAFRWRDMLESGKYSTIREIAVAESINESYVGRVLRLTLLAPDIVVAILTGHQLANLRLDNLMMRFPIAWPDQYSFLSATTSDP